MKLQSEKGLVVMETKIIKKALVLLLVCCMAVGMLPVATAAAEPITGTCGENVTWSLDLDTGVLTISGSGDMEGYASSYNGFTANCAPWRDYKDSITSVVVEEGVTSIGAFAFFLANNLTQVSLPYGLLRIGDHAFAVCPNLTDIELPDSLTWINGAAFMEDVSVAEITLPHSLIQIGDHALQRLNMEMVTIPYSASQNHFMAFYSTNIQNFYAEPDNPVYTSVDGVLFSKDMKTLLVYPSANPRTSYAIPEGVTTIKASIWDGPDELTFPASFTTFEDFSGPQGLAASNYTVMAGNSAFSSLDGVLFDKDRSTLIRYPIGRTETSYRVPDGVTTVGPYGFTNAASLTSITIPASVTNLSLEYGSFDGCDSLTDIYFEGSAFRWSQINYTDYGFMDSRDPEHIVNIHFGAEDKTYTVRYDPGEGTIRGDSMSPSVVAQGDTTTLLPSGGYYLAPTGKRFKSWEINGTEYLPGMTYTPTADVTATALWEDSSLPSGRCGENVYWDFDADTGTITISGSGEMLYPTGGCVPWLEMKPSITHAVVENGVTNLARGTFEDCVNLTDVTLADSIAQFEDSTFRGCDALKTVELPRGLTCLGASVFSGCDALEEITIPNTVTSIDDYAFHWCKSLREINIPSGVTSIGRWSFDYCTNLRSVTIPGSVKEIGEEAFYQDTNLESFVVEEGLERIGIRALSGCNALKNISLPGTVRGFDAGGCDALETVALNKGTTYASLSSCANLSAIYLPESLETIRLWTTAVPNDIYYAGSRLQWQHCVGRTMMDNKGNATSWPDIPVHYGNADVTYDRNGGTDGMPMMFVKKNSSLTLPVCRFVAPEGKVFKSWEVNGVEYQPGDSCVIEDDTVLKALWEDSAYTATFMADGVTVAEVGFLQGATFLDEPDVPAKAHYDGVWESYDLASATSNITVNAIYTQNNDHSASETAMVTAPTCLESGYTIYTCSICGNTRTEGETAALGHDYQLNADKSVAATPGHDGYEYYECTRNPAHFYKTPIIAPIVAHTATFMVGDEIIDQVVFEEGAVTLDEPALPQRPNYVGQWESYDLAAATSDITVRGLYTPVDPDAVSDVDAGAKAEYENGEVTMELSARATSRTIKVVSQQTKPVDVVLVLDQSGSMAETLSSRDRQSKRNALVSCANSFVAELHKNAVDTGADHRVAVVGFAYSAYNKGNYKNTGLLATANGKIINYNSIKNSDYATALLPIDNNGKINANVVTGINSIVADGATAADLGLKMARNIFAENPIQSERERIVIFITDGTPTSWGEDADLVRQTAAAAISEANTLKNGQGAKIYSVGVHANADPTASFTSAKDGVTTNSRGQFASYDFNRFLHAVSSNYPNAAAMSNLGAGNKADGYYMGVKDTSNLGSIFTNILYSTVYELKSFDKATLYYTLAPEFTLTMEQELALREELRVQGLTDSDIQVIRNQDGTTQLRFQNVKTQAVYGQDGALHYEAKVRFKVSANQSAPAGGSISTGTGSNGVEYGGSQIASLETPMVSIPQNRCLVAFTINGQVYQLRDMAAGEVITLPDTELASWRIPAGTAASGEYAVFEADSAPEQKYTIRWIIDGTETVEQYALGQVIVPPAVPAKEGYDFTGWSRSIPYSMPAYDLICEAIYSPAHTHSFELAYQTGSCREGLTIVYRCACGETQSKTEQPAEHSFVAVLADNGSTGTEVEKVVCTKCGHSEEQNINFKVSYSTGWKTTVLDLNLLQNEVNVVQPEAEIEMRFFVGEDGGRLYTVTRIDSDGKRTTYQTRSENGYLVFRANHFSIYVISELDETTSQPTETVSYEEAVNILDSKVDATPTAPLDGTSSSDNNRPGNGGSTRPTTKPVEETPVSPFADVAEQSWYYDSVKYVYEKGLMQGISATAFAPDQTTSRAMITTILWRLAGSPAMGGGKSTTFSDVPEDEWYTEAVEWAAVQGVVKGHDDGNFRPTDPITREQLAVMLYRYAGNPATAGTLDGFVDMNKASDYAFDALRWATEQGILTGKGGGILDPKGKATRAEVATILMRYCENKK